MAANANLSTILGWNVERHPDRDALVFGDRRWSYAELDRDVHALAAGLSARGVGTGDVVALLGSNSAAYLLSCLAVSRLGAVFLPLNHRLHGDELEYLIGHAEASLMLADASEWERADALVARVSSVREPIGLHAPAGAAECTVESLMTAHRGETVADALVDADTLQRIMYTSGTTSRPKGAMLTHGNVLWNMVVQCRELELTGRDRVLNFAPMYHVGGLDIPGFGIWYAGGTMIVLDRFDARTILEQVEQEGITGMVMVATMVHLIRDLPDRDDHDTRSLRWLIFSQVAEPLYRETQRVFPSAALIEGYGLTETCNGVAYLHASGAEEKIGSAGTPVAHTELRVVDDAGTPVGVDELGEIVVRGPKVGPGYWRDPEATAAVHRDGWFHTGDIGRIDRDGYLYVVDRKKDMIRSGGENVASSEIERVLYEHEAVAEAAVVGVPDEHWGEVPKAFVVARPGHEVDADAVIAHCRSRLAGFKTPKHVAFLDELPRNLTGKVLKRDLRELDRSG
jgi:fatty-acyl-CoA synthase